MKRYQLYIRLIDISFWISIAYLVRTLGRLTGLLLIPLPKPFALIFGIVTLINLALAIFLVVARFMRDEFAERIWHQAAQWFVYCLVTVPMIIAIVLLVFEDAIRVRVNNSWVEPDLLEEFQRHPDAVWHFVGGIGQAVISFGLLAPAFFVCIYKVLLWRDGR